MRRAAVVGAIEGARVGLRVLRPLATCEMSTVVTPHWAAKAVATVGAYKASANADAKSCEDPNPAAEGLATTEKVTTRPYE